MFIADAGAVIAACSITDYVMSSGQPAAQINVAIALEHIALAAVEEDLATCWIGAFNPHKVRQVLGIPKNIQIIELMCLGYPADKPKKPHRLPLTDIVRYNEWQF